MPGSADNSTAATWRAGRSLHSQVDKVQVQVHGSQDMVIVAQVGADGMGIVQHVKGEDDSTSERIDLGPRKGYEGEAHEEAPDHQGEQTDGQDGPEAAMLQGGGGLVGGGGACDCAARARGGKARRTMKSRSSSTWQRRLDR